MSDNMSKNLALKKFMVHDIYIKASPFSGEGTSIYQTAFEGLLVPYKLANAFSLSKNDKNFG